MDTKRRVSLTKGRNRGGSLLSYELLEHRQLLAVLSGFEITGYPSPTEAGTSGSFLLTAVDELGVKIDDYTGTVSFSSSDPIASIPSSYTFLASDRGDRTFSATFKTAGSQLLTVTDRATGVVDTISIDVDNTVLKRFRVSGFPSPTTAGDQHDFTVEAVDKYWNTVDDYTGTIAFTSSDTNAILPTDYTFTPTDAGVRTFQATLINTGSSRSITATDLLTGQLGRQSGIVVQNASIRYASSTNRIYLEDGVTTTLSGINAIIPNAPLTLVDPVNAVWKLDADLHIEDGSTLVLEGTSIGGDVDELRLKSDNVATSDAIVQIRADYGNILIDSTKITSWDSSVNGPDTEYSTYQRAFIRARSKLASDGTTPLESRMDIFNSEISHLGYAGSEAYGLSWKVNGDPGANFELYDQVDVYGDIQNNYIHHNYFGIYTYGHFGGVWTNNEVAHNVIYGIDPHDDSDSLIIENNYTHNNGTHGIICSKRCDNLTIRYNVSSNNGGNGIMLHREANDSLLEYNVTNDNVDSGIAIFDSYRNTIRNNESQGNKHGIRFSVGSADNQIVDNVLSNNADRGINFFKGSDLPTFGGDGRPKRNVFRGNEINLNGGYGIRVRDADENLFEANELLGNGRKDTIFFETAAGNTFQDNIVETGSRVKLRGNSTFTSDLTVRGQPDLEVNLDEFSLVAFVGDQSEIFQLVDNGGNFLPAVTSVGAAGSSMTVTSALIGVATDAVVRTLPFFVDVSSQSVVVLPTVWETSGDLRKAFTVDAELAALAIDYAVGDLMAGEEYDIFRDGQWIDSVTADASGVLDFSDAPGTSEEVLYELVRV